MTFLARAVLLGAFVSTAGFGQTARSVPVPDSELAEMRGGFPLPGGGAVNIGIVTDTYLNGALVVRSAYRVDGGTPAVTVSGRPEGNGLSELGLGDGNPVTTADGTIRLVRSADGARVEFNGGGTDVIALAGRNFGSIVTNTANDRAIDVITNVDIGLVGVTPDLLGSSMARASTLALDATTRLTR